MNNPKQITSYETFLTRKWVKSLVRLVIDSVVYYDINNNFSKINITKDKNSNVRESFFRALVELDVVNTHYINNKNIDSYIYYLLRNGRAEFVFYDGKYYLKNKSNEHVMSDKNFTIELLIENEAYLLSIYKAWLNGAPLSEMSKKLHLNHFIDLTNVENDEKLFEIALKNIEVSESPIIKLVSSKTIELIDCAMTSNFKSNHMIRNFLGKILPSVFLPYKYNIILNDKRTILDDMQFAEKEFANSMKDLVSDYESELNEDN